VACCVSPQLHDNQIFSDVNIFLHRGVRSDPIALVIFSASASVSVLKYANSGKEFVSQLFHAKNISASHAASESAFDLTKIRWRITIALAMPIPKVEDG
jgi:hypothetical protein